MKKWFAVVLLMITFFLPAEAIWGFDIKKLPDFQDGQWLFSGEIERHFILADSNYIWGRMKKYRLKEDQYVVGFEDFAPQSSEPFSKYWGHVSDLQYRGAMKTVDGVWLLADPADDFMVIPQFDAGGGIEGILVYLYSKKENKAYANFFKID